MNETEIAIVAASVLGAVIGYIGCGLMASRRLQAIRKETWAKAAKFYEAKAREERSAA